MNIQFFGAAQTVTGSMHLIEIGGKRILLDCGLYQGHRDEAYERNITFPFEPNDIDAIVLSHAHIDHSGNLPGIVKQGFRGDIFCTSATRDLCGIMLADSAYLQEKDIEHLEKKQKKHLDLLYTIDDVHEAVALMRIMPYHRAFNVVNGVECQFYAAGHILGAAVSRLTLTEGAKKKTLAFTGDLGRKHRPLLLDPEFVSDANVVISESTYGDRIHEPMEESVAMLAEVVERTSSRGGKLVIPAFSIGRTQDILFLLHSLAMRKKIPSLPIFVDSPLSVNATSIYKIHQDCFNDDTRRSLSQDEDSLGFNDATYITSTDDSKRLNDMKDPCIIISASGMCEGGRVLHHIANNAGDERNTILICGYQASNTLGARLVNHARSVKIYGDEIQVLCNVENLHGMSAHGDQNDLVNFVENCNGGNLENVYLVHGEPDAQTAFKNVLNKRGLKNVSIPQHGQKVDL